MKNLETPGKTGRVDRYAPICNNKDSTKERTLNKSQGLLRLKRKTSVNSQFFPFLNSSTINTLVLAVI